MSTASTIIAIAIAQFLALGTFYAGLNRGRWKNRRKAGLVLFGLEVGYVFICLLVADLL